MILRNKMVQCDWQNLDKKNRKQMYNKFMSMYSSNYSQGFTILKIFHFLFIQFSFFRFDYFYRYSHSFSLENENRKTEKLGLELKCLRYNIRFSSPMCHRD